MRILLSLIFLISAHCSQAGILEEVYQIIYLQSDSLDTTLGENQSKYTFSFSALDGSTNEMIYSIDGVQKNATLNNNSFEILTTPGKHVFQFFYTENYYEVYSDSLAIRPGYHSSYDVIMERSDIQIIVDKPVIYLYPTEEIDVEVKLNIQGEPTFFYPEYIERWKCKATPSGELSIGENTYNYLFWEAKQSLFFNEQEMQSGFNVKGENAVSFLKEKLREAGFNSKEMADFITYWGPRLAANELNFVRFEFNQECNRYAELDIHPTPQNIFRMYITWMSIDSELEVESQEIPHYSRDGFSVLEWGGSELKQVAQSL